MDVACFEKLLVTYSRDIDKSYSWQKLYPLIYRMICAYFRVSGSSQRCFSPPKILKFQEPTKAKLPSDLAPLPRGLGVFFQRMMISLEDTNFRYLKVLGIFIP